MTRLKAQYVLAAIIVTFLALLVTPGVAPAAPPVLTVPGPQSVNEQQNLAFTVSAFDPDGQAVQLRASSVPSGASFVDNHNNTGSFNWTPASGTAGSYLPSFLADDTFGGTDRKTVSITVTVSNTPPVLGPISDRTVDPGTMTFVSIWASDDDNDALTFTATGLPPFGSFTDYGDGTASLALTPAANQPPGTWTVTVSVSDGTDSDSKSFMVSVTGSNPAHAPTLQQFNDPTVAEGNTGSVSLAADDADGDALTWTSGLPAFANLVVLTNANGSSTARLDLAPGFCNAGNYAAWVAVSDGALSSGQRNFTIHVTDVPRGPTWAAPASGTTLTMDVGTEQSVALAASDPDLECGGAAPVFSVASSDAGAALTLQVDAGSPGNATLHVHANGPNGQYHVTLRVTDGSNASLHADRSLTVVANEVERAVEARAWSHPKPLHLHLGSWWQRFYLEPVGGTFTPADVNPASVHVRAWEGAGSGGYVALVPDRTVLGEDNDGNGITEFRFDVSREELAGLFSNLREQTDGPISIDAELFNGTPVHASFTARVVPDREVALKRVGPNPMNPEAVLEIETKAPGRLRVMVFDVSGRMVRVLANEASAPAGSRELHFDGHDDRGHALRAGRYYIRVESVAGIDRAPLTILP